MSHQPKRWQFAPAAPVHFINALSDLGSVLAQVLYNRGLTTPQNASSFLSGDLPLHDPMQMLGMGKAVGRIRQAIKRKEKIVIYGDFDADGVTSTAVLVTTIRALGGVVEHYIPNRIDEGYGLNTPALLELARRGTKLVVTVDCGIRSVEEVQAGRDAGLDIIVTDHHSIGEIIPPAYAVLNPKQVNCPYPEDMLAGVGIAFKLASALLKVFTEQERTPPSINQHDLLDLVAVGTVADLAPLARAENRRLVQLGLDELSKGRRPGLYKLLEEAGVAPENVTTTTIGFIIGPRLNAAGRLQSATTAYKLLVTEDWQEATELAKELQDLNTRRQEYTLAAYELAREMALTANNGNGASPSLIFAAHPEFLPGIVGLVAGRLTEEFYRPSVVVEMGEQESHGSCRSIPEFNITAALDRCADLLVRHGGHAQAAGFTVQNDNIPALHERLKDIAEIELAQHDSRPTLIVDADVPMSSLTMDLVSQLRALEPTGTENPEPTFVTRRLRVREARLVGKENNHLKLRVGDGPFGMDAIAFGQGHWFSDLPPMIDVAYHLQVNEWNDRLTLQMQILDIHPSERVK
ncbi:MAG: single-stranded-DNA-specific exonuclease RecJ [Chloroflexi bacterium]|nr:single-stranded-DNA-specific exonuclease RecJ [Chloroflexota bacterium]